MLETKISTHIYGIFITLRRPRDPVNLPEPPSKHQRRRSPSYEVSETSVQSAFRSSGQCAKIPGRTALQMKR